MALSSDLISQFVKITNDKQETKKEATMYGTIVDQNGTKYVQLDGSNVNTPITSTTAVEDGDRVTVLIKDHKAVVTGNLSSPSVREGTFNEKINEFDIIVAYRVSTEELTAANAQIENLKAIAAKFENLTAVQAQIETIESKYANLEHINANEAEILNAEIETLRTMFMEATDITTEDLEAANASIDQLQAVNGNFTYVSAEQLKARDADIENLEANKADIDFANIGDAAIEKFYAVSGIIKDLTLETGVVAKELVGVYIKGDFIETNTLRVDQLVVRGDDGNYYKLSTDFSKLEGVTPVAEDQIHGSAIVAKSIVAEKISVSDLVAFGATIGGFHIRGKSIEDGTNGAIYSGVKESIDADEFTGIYLDEDGQIAFGDNKQFIKFYKDGTTNSYKLEIVADNIRFGSELETAITQDRMVVSKVNANPIYTTNTIALGAGSNTGDERYVYYDDVIPNIVKDDRSNYAINGEPAEVVEIQGGDTIDTDNDGEYETVLPNFKCLKSASYYMGYYIAPSYYGYFINCDNAVITYDTVSGINETRTEVLSADANGVDAADLHAKTYLKVGPGDGTSRFEKMKNGRMGCFWIGG